MSCKEIWFHASPSYARDSILEYGLDRSRGKSPWFWSNRPENRGIFLYSSLPRARNYINSIVKSRKILTDALDIWEVDISGIEQLPDNDQNTVPREGRCRVLGPISPNRLNLAETITIPTEKWRPDTAAWAGEAW